MQNKHQKHAILFSLSLFGLLSPVTLLAETFVPDKIQRFPEKLGDDRQRFPEKRLETPESLPPLAYPLAPPADQWLSGQLHTFVKKIKLTGNEVFTEADLATIIRPYENREITSEDLQTLREALTVYYVNHGYINSGAIIPDQRVKDGIIEIRIIEGTLTNVDVTDTGWLRSSYIEKRVRLGNEARLNLPRLQERLQLLQQDRLIERINAELRPGTQSGQSELRMRVLPARPYEFGLAFNNYRSPSVGSLRGEVYAGHYNLTGFGDSLNFRYGITEGLNDYSVGYALPLNAYDTRLRLYYDRSDSTVVEKPFDTLKPGIESETEAYGINLSHPFILTPQQQLIGQITLEHRQSDTSILGRPFSFSAGPHNGRTQLTALRFAQDWVKRDSNQVIAARSTVSWGFDAFGTTRNPGKLPDGEFVSWLGQFQWVKRLGNSDNQLLFRSDLQLSPHALLPLEKFVLGGHASVRGYRENELVRDNGWINSWEFRIPVFRLPIPGLSTRATDGMVQIAPFMDVGWSFNTDAPTPGPRVIYSLGLGLRWDPHPKIHSEFYWGHALRQIKGGSGDLQDDGIHFQLTAQIF